MQGKKTKEAINKGNCERHEKVTKRTGKSDSGRAPPRDG